MVIGSWILILTLITGNGVAVTSAGDFAGKDKCEAAAQAWLKQDIHGSTKARAVCVLRYGPAV